MPRGIDSISVSTSTSMYNSKIITPAMSANDAAIIVTMRRRSRSMRNNSG